MTDGSEAALFKVDDTTGDTTINPGDLTLIANFVGWNDNVLGQIDDDNFADFSIS